MQVHARTARRDAWRQDRWVHPPSKRSGRFTKRGPRPRAASLAEVRRYRKRDESEKRERDQASTNVFNRFYSPTGRERVRLINPWISQVSYDPWSTGEGTINVANSGYVTGIDFAEEPSATATGAGYTGLQFVNITTNATSETTTTPIYTLDYQERCQYLPGQHTTQFVAHTLNYDASALRQSFVRLGESARGAAEHLGFMASQAAALGEQITATLDQWGQLTFSTKPDRRAQLRAQMSPARPSVRADQVSFANCSGPELVALQLLKKMLDEDAWRKYLKYGFVLVEGDSGLVYQIRRNEWHVLVYLRGKLVAELCVGLANRHYMPPTDEVIARKLIVECDEADIWRRANVSMRGKGAAGLPRFAANESNVRLLDGFRQAAVA